MANNTRGKWKKYTRKVHTIISQKSAKKPLRL